MTSMEDFQKLVNKVLSDEEVTDEEYASVIEACREGRRAGAGTGKSAKSAVPLVSLDDLFPGT